MMPGEVPLRVDRHDRLLDQTLLDEPDYRFLHELVERADPARARGTLVRLVYGDERVLTRL